MTAAAVTATAGGGLALAGAYKAYNGTCMTQTDTNMDGETYDVGVDTDADGLVDMHLKDTDYDGVCDTITEVADNGAQIAVSASKRVVKGVFKTLEFFFA